MILHSLNESIVQNAAMAWFGELGYAIGHEPHIAHGELRANDVLGLPSRISTPSSPILNLSLPKLRSCSSVLHASSYVLKEAMP